MALEHFTSRSMTCLKRPPHSVSRGSFQEDPRPNGLVCARGLASLSQPIVRKEPCPSDEIKQ